MKKYIIFLILACAACQRDQAPGLPLADIPGEIAFISRRAPGTSEWQLFAMGVDGSNQRRIGEKNVACAPFVVSHDGKKILYTTYENDSRHLYVMGIDGGPAVLLASGKGFCGAPAWAPDDQRILFVKSDNTNGKDCHIYIVDIDGLHQQQLTTGKESSSPQWFPDGHTIVFAAQDNGGCGIYTMQADGSNQKKISPDGKCFGAPRVSPTGSKVAMVWDNKDGSQIFVMGANGAGLKQLTTSVNPKYFDTGFPREGNENPVWSPDGNKIAYVSWANGSPDIFVINSDGSQDKRLTSSPLRDENPGWTKDGRYILFSSNRNQDVSAEIYVMKANGQSQTALTKYIGDDIYPVFIAH